MSAVARLVAARGVDVTGSDKKRSAYFSALEAAGVDEFVFAGCDALAVITGALDALELG